MAAEPIVRYRPPEVADDPLPAGARRRAVERMNAVYGVVAAIWEECPCPATARVRRAVLDALAELREGGT
jgi:hypothetical protein